jgi:hypothetical protein
MFESDPVATTFLAEQKPLWTNTHKLADMVPRVGEFDALFYVGGHGRMYPSLLPFSYIYPHPMGNNICMREKIEKRQQLIREEIIQQCST